MVQTVTETDMTEVVAALIWADDKFMICQRPASKARGLLWEFVGGKVEPHETREQALMRECREELDIAVDVGEAFTDVVYEYPDITIHLTLFNCAIAAGEPKLIEHNDLRWITPDEIGLYRFCPADTQMLERIKEKSALDIRHGIYRHYKGNEYEVIGMAKHSETLEPMVVYRALYGNRELWVRPASMWSEIVETPDGKVRRFTYIGKK